MMRKKEDNARSGVMKSEKKSGRMNSFNFKPNQLKNDYSHSLKEHHLISQTIRLLFRVI